MLVNQWLGPWGPMIAISILTVAGYIEANGGVWPSDAAGWQKMAFALAVIWSSSLLKAAAVGSQPGDPQTPQRIAGALAKGETIAPDEVSKSLNAPVIVANATKTGTGGAASESNA